MTSELVKVTQADRDAAARVLEKHEWAYNPEYCPAMLRHGNADEHPLVNAFARHRISHLPEGAEVRDRARELLASEYEAADCKALADDLRMGEDPPRSQMAALRAIERALSPHPVSSGDEA